MSCLTWGTARHDLVEGDAVVGSGALAQWRIPGIDLAPRHFVVTVAGERVTVRAFALDDVIAVDGAQTSATPVALRDGDTIDAGEGRFRFWTGEPAQVDDGKAPNPGEAFLVDETLRLAYPLRAITGMGRDPSNEILLHDATASRFHAEVRREAGGYAVHAMGSSGTQVNARRMSSPVLLAPGDVLEMGFVSFRFVRTLPAGVHIATPEDAGPLDPDAARRPTLSLHGARRSSGRTREGRAIPLPRSPGGTWAWVGAAIGAVALAWWLLAS